ncbi:hypothetical protein [Mesorhizobium sp. M0701]|uniref:hypothetical protein n=1 Tax=Mesorhizobium sp. M0701 TaxID=2956989 RepID=UPI0033375130
MNTLDQQTALEQAARKRIKDSHALDGDAGRLTHFIANGPVATSWMLAAMDTAGR